MRRLFTCHTFLFAVFSMTVMVAVVVVAMMTIIAVVAIIAMMTIVAPITAIVLPWGTTAPPTGCPMVAA